MEKVFPHCGKTGPIFPRCGKSGFFPRVRPVIKTCASPLDDRCGLGGSPISRLPPVCLCTTIHQLLVVHARFSFQHMPACKLRCSFLWASQTKTLIATKNTKRHKDYIA